jgi:uncharacterized protein Smg (DUF494 family)
MSGRRRVTGDQAELIYVAALFGDEELRDQLRRIGYEDADLEDALALREALLVEVEKLRRDGPGR